MFPSTRVAAPAELPTVRNDVDGGRWSHFAPGDRVLVFGEPDPATGWSRVRRGTVTDVARDGIGVDFGAAGRTVYAAADRIRISHVAGSCRCVVALPTGRGGQRSEVDGRAASTGRTSSAPSTTGERSDPTLPISISTTSPGCSP